MPYAYETGEKREWTARDARELEEDYKRAIRVTQKHLDDLKSQATAQVKDEQPPVAEEKSFMGKLFCRRNTGKLQDREPSHEANHANSRPEKRPFPPKPKQTQGEGSHWWNRGHCHAPGQSSQSTVEREPYTPLGVANRTSPPPPIPPRYDLMHYPPDRVRRKSEKESASRRRARERALYHLQTDHDIRRFVVLDRPNAPPVQLKPGTWIPGQMNAVDFDRTVIAADKRVDSDVDEFGGLTTRQLIDRFPKPPCFLPPRKSPPLGPLPMPVYTHLPSTRPLKIVPRRQYQDIRDIPIPPAPTEPERSNRDSFIELRRKRSYYV
ncbi:unnamed protein product [Rhizoctonia solani]|uniref:Uncharacterized protein n=1 Tax=Rhizoctonia solani TaxID=456999 RepID=A0A8H2WBE3_9AGAM|nr:unnamed protein product [Rhizoctonia solani]